MRLLAPASIALMLPPDFRGGLAWWGRDASYGERRGEVWSHGGFMEGVRTHVHLWPNHRVGVVLLQNGEADYSGAMDALKRAVVGAVIARGPQADRGTTSEHTVTAPRLPVEDILR